MEINELRDKVLAALGHATGGAKGIADKTVGGARNIVGSVSDKARAGGRMAKLAMEAATGREELKKTYLEIGKLYYDTHKDDPEGFFVQLFEEVRIAEEGIAAKEAEIAELKDSLKDVISVEVERDFADVVDETEAEAGGVREAAEEKFEEIREAAAEKLEEIKEAAEEKFEEVRAAAEAKFEELRENAVEKAEQAAEAAETSAEQAAEAAEACTEQAAEAAEACAEQAAESVEACAEQAEEAAETAAEAAAECCGCASGEQAAAGEGEGE